jgi:hypothetical protein
VPHERVRIWLRKLAAGKFRPPPGQTGSRGTDASNRSHG